MKKIILSLAMVGFFAVGVANAQTASTESASKTKTACCKKSDHKLCKKDGKACVKDSAKCAKKCEHSKK
jgi:Ni/Co efflux regulator RcnB